jgi:hypothetical protein
MEYQKENLHLTAYSVGIATSVTWGKQSSVCQQESLSYAENGLYDNKFFSEKCLLK